MTTAVASAAVAAVSDAGAKEDWEAVSVDVSSAADSIVINDQWNTPHTFRMAEIKDLYFRPVDEDKQRFVLTIWKRPQDRKSDVVESFAGVFFAGGEPRMKIKEIVNRFRLAR